MYRRGGGASLHFCFIDKKSVQPVQVRRSKNRQKSSADCLLKNPALNFLPRPFGRGQIFKPADRDFDWFAEAAIFAKSVKDAVKRFFIFVFGRQLAGRGRGFLGQFYSR